MEEDKVLMNLTKDGNKEAFEKLVLKYRVIAMKFAMKNIKNAYIAEDIVQDSFIAIYLNREKFNDKYNFKTYLFTVIKNKSIDYMRKESRKTYKEDIELIEPSTEKKFIDKYDKKKLQESIDKLNDDYKKALCLYAYDEMSYQRIAKSLNKNLSQVKVLIYRARKKLSSIMEDDKC